MKFSIKYITGKSYLLFNPCILLIIFLLIIQNSSMSQETSGNDKKVYFSITADIYSKYLWRGLEFSEGYVVQPCITASYRGFSAYVWSNIEPGLTTGKKLNEYNASVIFTTEYKNLTIEPSLLFYFFPEPEEPNTGELMLKLSYPIYGVFSVFNTHNLDIIKYHGSYVGDLGINVEHQFHKKFMFDANTSIGWSSGEFNKIYHDIPRGALSILDINASLTYSLSKYFYLRPRFEVQIHLDKEIRESTGENDIYSYGITLGADF
jgi:hypothetical protein